jgi:hypothetical protein
MSPTTEYALAVRGSHKIGAVELTLDVAARGVLGYVRGASVCSWPSSIIYELT